MDVQFCKNGHERTQENTLKNGRCRLCRNKRERINYQKNIDAHRERRETLRDWQKNYNKQYYIDNAENIKINSAKYKAKNSRYYKEYMAKYRADNPDVNKLPVSELRDSYVAGLLKLPTKDCPPQLLEIAKLNITLKRELKQCKQLRP